VRLVRDGGESKSESRREGVEGGEDTGPSMIGVMELRCVETDDRGEVDSGVGGAKVDQTGTGTGATTSGDGTATEDDKERAEKRRKSSRLTGGAERGGEVEGERFASGERGRFGVEGRLIEGGGEEGGDVDIRGERGGDLRCSESKARRDPVGAFDED